MVGLGMGSLLASFVRAGLLFRLQLFLCLFFWFGHLFIWDTTEILFFGVRNEPIYKSAYKRWIFTQLILFSSKGLKKLVRDKDMRMMLFVTGNIYRDTGKSVQEQGTENRDNDTIKENAFLNISSVHNNISRFKRDSIKLFGIEELIDESVIRRVARIEKVSVVFSFTGVAARSSRQTGYCSRKQ